MRDSRPRLRRAARRSSSGPGVDPTSTQVLSHAPPFDGVPVLVARPCPSMLPTISVVLPTSASASIGWSVAPCSLASWRGIEPRHPSYGSIRRRSEPSTSSLRSSGTCSLSRRRRRTVVGLQAFPSITNTRPRARGLDPRSRTVVPSQAYRIPRHRQSIARRSLPPTFFFDDRCVWTVRPARSVPGGTSRAIGPLATVRVRPSRRHGRHVRPSPVQS